MKATEFRIYFEVLEQGFDIKDYLTATCKNLGIASNIQLIYSKKIRSPLVESESIINRIRKIKDIDLLITAVYNDSEYPLLLIEYSTAVPTDDHIMQRSDVMYWGRFYNVPSLKISPLNKGMENNHGGGDKITDRFEKGLAILNNAVFYTVKWHTDDNGLLVTNPSRLSCIAKSNELSGIFHSVINTFNTISEYSEYYPSLLNKYLEENQDCEKITTDFVQEKFPSSTRFTWINTDLMVKINRFGHALDPDRGVVYFANMMLGRNNIISEIQVERRSFEGRGGYKSLFDLCSHEKLLNDYVKNLELPKMDAKTAYYIFTHGLNIEKYFPRSDVDSEIVLEEDQIYSYLCSGSGFAAKSLFILSKQIILSNKDREKILTITIPEKPVKDYLSSLKIHTYDITPISPMDALQINEDIVTYGSLLLLKKAGINILAVSYPGAQGDRCILVGTGKGRNVKREYVDLIGYDCLENGTLQIILHECKDYLSKSGKDVEKMKDIIKNKEKMEGLKTLTLKLIQNNKITETKIGIGGKGQKMPTTVGLDYVMLFDLSSDNEGTNIFWNIGVISSKMSKYFDKLLDSEGRYAGKEKIEQLYVIS